MQPISGTSASKGELMKLIAKECGVETESILSTDLYLYPRSEGRIWGIKDEFVSSPRIDDLQCAFGCLIGLTEAKPQNSIPVVFIADNEEVGSSTKQGANSTFLSDTVKRINSALGGDDITLMKNVASSFMVSADNGHAIHPNHPEYSDSANYPKINSGIVIKHAASQSYTTDSVSGAIFDSICKKAGVPTQHFANRSDLRGGSTLGNISNTQVSLNTVDIGMPQLAMHSCYETAGALDTEYLANAMKEYFSSSISAIRDGEYEIK
jgi:aspartyl aminopeptidase